MAMLWQHVLYVRLCPACRKRVAMLWQHVLYVRLCPACRTRVAMLWQHVLYVRLCPACREWVAALWRWLSSKQQDSPACLSHFVGLPLLPVRGRELAVLPAGGPRGTTIVAVEADDLLALEQAVQQECQQQPQEGMGKAPLPRCSSSSPGRRENSGHADGSGEAGEGEPSSRSSAPSTSPQLLLLLRGLHSLGLAFLDSMTFGEAEAGARGGCLPRAALLQGGHCTGLLDGAGLLGALTLLRLRHRAADAHGRPGSEVAAGGSSGGGVGRGPGAEALAWGLRAVGALSVPCRHALRRALVSEEAMAASGAAVSPTERRARLDTLAAMPMYIAASAVAAGAAIGASGEMGRQGGSAEAALADLSGECFLLPQGALPSSSACMHARHPLIVIACVRASLPQGVPLSSSACMHACACACLCEGAAEVCRMAGWCVMLGVSKSYLLLLLLRRPLFML